MSDEDRRALEQPYAPSCITSDQLRKQYGDAITKPGNLRGENEQDRFLREGLALKLPGQQRQ